MSLRAQQTASVLHRAVQSVLVEGLADPRLDAMITVTDVKVTEDIRTAIVRVSISPERKEKLAMHGLQAAARHIRRKVADLVSIHHPPELVFKLDRGAKNEAAVLEALAKVRAEGRDVAPEAEPPPTDPGPEPSS
jgi:ribosome-binding factor A